MFLHHDFISGISCGHVSLFTKFVAFIVEIKSVI